MPPAPRPPLWECPKCGARLVSRNLYHACGRYTLGDLFARCEPHLPPLFDRFVEMVRSCCGPVTVVPQKTRVVLMTRIRFGGVQPRKHYLLAGLLYVERHPHPLFTQVEHIPPRYWVHRFRLASLQDLEHPDLPDLLRRAYAVGNQQHLD